MWNVIPGYRYNYLFTVSIYNWTLKTEELRKSPPLHENDVIDAPDDIKSTSTISTINKYVVIKSLFLNYPGLY